MTAGTEADNDVVQAYKRDRRAAIRRFHPDRGGSAAELLRALTEVDERFGLGTAGTSTTQAEPEVVVIHTRTYLLRLGVRRLRLLVTTARERFPRNWPGARRSTRL